MMATMDTSKVHISTFPLNLIVNDASLSTGRWMKSNFFPNTNITMATSTNTMAKSIDTSDDNLYILINDYVQEP